MIDLLDRSLRRLLDGSGADVAVVWSRVGESTSGLVICTYPPDIVAAGTAWPATDHASESIIHRDLAVLARLIPTSLRLELPTAPTAALPVDLPDPHLVLLLIWCGSPAAAELPEGSRRLIADEIADLARIVAVQSHHDRAAQRLKVVVDGLEQGVVSVDHALDQVSMNPAAAKLLNLQPGDHRSADFAAAMADLGRKALNRTEITAIGQRLLAEPGTEVDCTWRFADHPTHLRVTSRPLRQGGFTARIWVFDDVSDLAQALEASDEAQALLRVTADGMLDPQVLLEAVRDPNGRVIDFRYRSVNHAACSYLGLDDSDLLGHTQLENSPNLEGSELQRRYIQCLEDGEPVLLDDYAFFNEILDDARRYDIRATRAGTDLISLTWSDVTERFISAQRIATSERNYRLLAENAGDMVTLVRDGRFVWVSPSVESLLGAPPDYWLGRQVREIIPDADATAFASRLATLTGGGVVRERVRITAIDGVIHWVDIHARPFYDAEGRPDGLTAALRLVDDEVAAQQQAEVARRLQSRADERYRRSMDNAAIGMCLINTDGGFDEVNGALCTFFGYDAETLKSKTWQELTAEEFLAEDLENVTDILEGRRDSYRLTKQYVHADGHRIWGDLSVSCTRDENGAVENFIAQIADITAVVEADEQNRILSRRLQRYSDRMAAELNSAAAYMSSIMPRGLTGKVEVSSRYLPSRELGGDCFDYTWIDDEHLLLYLIDVSGHGIEPALLTVSVHNMLRSGSFDKESFFAPETVLSRLNRLFQMDQQNDHYFTMWLGVYQTSTRTLRYCNAGAPPAFAFTSVDGKATAVAELPATAPPVGMFEDAVFTSGSYVVPPGCRMLVFSDGASEVELTDGRQLALADFKALTMRLAGSPNWSLDDLIAELHSLTRSDVFDDDCSLIQLTFD